ERADSPNGAGVVQKLLAGHSPDAEEAALERLPLRPGRQPGRPGGAVPLQEGINLLLQFAPVGGFDRPASPSIEPVVFALKADETGAVGITILVQPIGEY